VFSRLGVPITMPMIHDGGSNTIMAGEALPEQSSWFRTPAGFTGPNHYREPNWASALSGNAAGTTIVPINYASELKAGCALNSYENHNISWGFKSNHMGGAFFVFADGSVRKLNETIEMKTYQLLGCRDDNQDLPEEY
jgi:hypothetical protein